MQRQPGVLETFVADISKAVEGFSEHDLASRRQLDQLAAQDPLKFFAAGIHVVAAAKPSDGLRYLIQLLAKDKRLSNWLLDPKVCTAKEAATIARAAANALVQLESTFEMALNKGLQQQASAANTDRILRILHLLETIGSQRCWDSFQVELMAYPDKVVRSKAALLIGRSQRDPEWIMRRLLDRDPRVQANAVETLWNLEASEAKPHLLNALKSKHNRVFANAALGLYRLGDPVSIRALLEATQHEDPLFRVSALWAIGQTRDPRFLPALTLQFKTAQGKLRLAVAAAMSRIRQRGKSGGEPLKLRIEILRAAVEAGGVRRLMFTLASEPAKNLSGVRATDFLVWENGTPVQEYEARQRAQAELLVAGFVGPWHESGEDALEKALQEGLGQCLEIKRKNDLWRIDRYAMAAEPPPVSEPAPDSGGKIKPAEEPQVPYDDSAITPQIKTAQGCVADPDQIRKIVELAVPRARAASGALSALQRQAKAMSHRNGRRHAFVILNDQAGAELKVETSMAVLRGAAETQSTIFHGIAVDGAGEWGYFRELCLSNPEGTFVETDSAGLASAVAGSYAGVSNQFEVSYSVAAGESQAEKAMVKIKVASEQGTGEAEVTLQSVPEPAASTQAEAEQPAA